MKKAKKSQIEKWIEEYPELVEKHIIAELKFDLKEFFDGRKRMLETEKEKLWKDIKEDYKKVPNKFCIGQLGKVCNKEEILKEIDNRTEWAESLVKMFVDGWIYLHRERRMGLAEINNRLSEINLVVSKILGDKHD